MVPMEPNNPCHRPSAVELSGVSHRYGERRAVDSITWGVGRHDHWAVLGPNGAGKTTLLKIIAGYLWPNDGGRVLRDGQEFTDLRELRKRIGWVSTQMIQKIPPREPVIKTVLSGKFAQMGLVEFHGMQTNGADHQRARMFLEQVASNVPEEQRFGTLSQGQQQKVLIARARMAGPLLLILDDPCVGLDPGAREILLGGLQQLASQADAPSLILVTHHVEEIFPALAHTLVLRDGQMLACGATEEVVTSELMTELYGVPAQLERRDGRFWPVLGNGDL